MAATKISATEKRTMINRVKARIAAGTLTMSAAAIELDISRSTLSRWLSAEANDTPVEQVKASITTKSLHASQSLLKSRCQKSLQR